MDISLCKSSLKNFDGKRVLVVGDLMLDEHIWGTVGRISPEAPVMVVEVDSPESDCMPGGAANVANNIRALGGKAGIVGVIGDDEGGSILINSLKNAGVDVSGVFVDKNRPTTRKTRIWASHRHQVVRVDRESKRKISPSVAKKIIEYVNDCAGSIDAILISDYYKGVATREAVAAIIKAANESGKVSASNPKPKSVPYYAGIGVMTLNQSEAVASSGVEIDDISDVVKAGRKLLSITHCKNLVITRGGQGMSVFGENGDIVHIPAVESEVYDVAGAGDTVISALTLALSCGLDIASSATIANCAAGAVVRKVGVATTSVDEIGTLLGS